MVFIYHPIAIAMMIVRITSRADSLESSARCWKQQDLTEFCDYRNVCYSNSEGLLIGRAGIPLGARHEIVNQGHINSYSHVLKMDYLNEGLLPWRAFLPGGVVNVNAISDPNNIWATANTTLLMAFDADVPNIFHSSEKLLAGHGALWYLNQAGNDPIGQYDAVQLLRSHESMGSWEHKFLSILFEKATAQGRVAFREALDQYGDQRLCFRRLVIPGTSIFFFGGPMQAAAVRTLAYRASLGAIAPICDHALITIIQRRSSRRIINLDEIVELIIRPRGVLFQVVHLEDLSFDEQVRVMAESRVLVAVHGAGLSNIIFQQVNGVVLELFAYNYVYHLYHNIATSSGLFHLTYEASRQETLYGNEIPFDRHSSYLCLTDDSCASATKGADIRLDPDRFAASLDLALSLVGPCH